ncbi:tyrosine-type recombinase/integrase [Sinorhizobium meliloti]|uniref:tyrosine-type recombinase/integrase n=1 Tax=Rhizobium meliloti TaxID=382 RepID=UPI001F1748F2|nr:tyrosine-type recombinase/integrase [Sinorhizobium meliloti]
MAFGASAAAPCMGDVRRAIGAIGATTSVDIRDRAILLLLATTGIRNGELRAIRLRDIDWRTGEVFVRRTKGKRDQVVPLLEETGAALADYILRARPKVDSPYLLLSFTPVVGPFKFAAPISKNRAEAVAACRVELGRVAGAHLLRHSLATQLVGQRKANQRDRRSSWPPEHQHNGALRKGCDLAARRGRTPLPGGAA